MASDPDDDKTDDLFNEYVHQLKAGDLIQASANLSSLKSQIRGEDLSDPFWNERLPPAHRVILLVGVLCDACTDGACPVCHGKRYCQSCEGKGLCKACAGHGGEWLACQSCVCKTCGGKRFCMECKGRRNVPCNACGGSGVGKEEQRFDPCPSCGGAGMKQGLKGPNNANYYVKCLRCNGTKGTYTTLRSSCPTCEGSGRKVCGSCRGTGSCAACRGLGRMSECSICQGQGRYLNPCPTCQGKKTCVDCSGSKLCHACKGQGVCSSCFGKNLVIRYRLPVDRRWLVHPLAKAIRTADDKVVQELVNGTTVSFQLNGRTISSDITDGSMLWASPAEELRQVSSLFVP